jgi:hypothetical protein
VSETLRTERCVATAVSTDGRTASPECADLGVAVFSRVGVVVGGLVGAGSEGKREPGSSVSGESVSSGFRGVSVKVGCLLLTTMVSSLASNFTTSIDSSLIVTGASENDVASVVWVGDCDILPEVSGLEDRADLDECSVAASVSSAGQIAVNLSTSLSLRRDRCPSSSEDVTSEAGTSDGSNLTESGLEIS